MAWKLSSLFKSAAPSPAAGGQQSHTHQGSDHAEGGVSYIKESAPSGAEKEPVDDPPPAKRSAVPAEVFTAPALVKPPPLSNRPL